MFLQNSSLVRDTSDPKLEIEILVGDRGESDIGGVPKAGLSMNSNMHRIKQRPVMHVFARKVKFFHF